MSTRASTDVSLAQMGLAAFLKQWLYEDGARRYKLLYPNRKTVPFFATIAEAVTRDLEAIRHSEDGIAAGDIDQLRNPFRGTPAQWDPLAEHVLRRFKKSLVQNRAGRKGAPDHIEELPREMFWQNLMRALEQIRESSGLLKMERVDAQTATDAAMYGMALIWRVLIRYLINMKYINTDTVFIGEYWDGLSFTPGSPKANDLKAKFGCSELPADKNPSPYYPSPTAYFPDDDLIDIEDAIQTLFIDEPIDAYQRRPINALGRIAMAIRLRGRSTFYGGQLPDVAVAKRKILSDIAHSTEKTFTVDFETRKQHIDRSIKGLSMQRDIEHRVNPYWKYNDPDAIRINADADRELDKYFRETVTRLGTAVESDEYSRDMFTQLLLCEIRVAIKKCATIVRTTHEAAGDPFTNLAALRGILWTDLAGKMFKFFHIKNPPASPITDTNFHANLRSMYDVDTAIADMRQGIGPAFETAGQPGMAGFKDRSTLAPNSDLTDALCGRFRYESVSSDTSTGRIKIAEDQVEWFWGNYNHDPTYDWMDPIFTPPAIKLKDPKDANKPIKDARDRQANIIPYNRGMPRDFDIKKPKDPLGNDARLLLKTIDDYAVAPPGARPRLGKNFLPETKLLVEQLTKLQGAEKQPYDIYTNSSSNLARETSNHIRWPYPNETTGAIGGGRGVGVDSMGWGAFSSDFGDDDADVFAPLGAASSSRSMPAASTTYDDDEDELDGAAGAARPISAPTNHGAGAAADAPESWMSLLQDDGGAAAASTPKKPLIPDDWEDL